MRDSYTDITGNKKDSPGVIRTRTNSHIDTRYHQNEEHPKLYHGNNKIHGVRITTYDKFGNTISARYLSGLVLSKYQYNTKTNELIPLPSMRKQVNWNKTHDNLVDYAE